MKLGPTTEEELLEVKLLEAWEQQSRPMPWWQRLAGCWPEVLCVAVGGLLGAAITTGLAALAGLFAGK